MTKEEQTGRDENEEHRDEEQVDYVLIRCPVDGVPVSQSVLGTKTMLKTLRKIYREDDQQYLFIVKGDLGHLAKINGNLIISFSDRSVRVPVEKSVKKLTDGWLGD